MPPPPIGATTASRPSTCSISSREQVACPAMTRGSLYGCTKSAPVAACTSAKTASRDEVDGSHSVMTPP